MAKVQLQAPCCQSMAHIYLYPKLWAQFSFMVVYICTENIIISMGECNTILSAYTKYMYRQLE